MSVRSDLSASLLGGVRPLKDRLLPSPSARWPALALVERQSPPLLERLGDLKSSSEGERGGAGPR